MNEQRTDFELLQGFARQGDQRAFADLVRRHLDLVYATSFRKVQEEGVAQEVAQNVFAALARKAWQFASDDCIPAWLYRTTLLESKSWLRGEMRRRRREQTAAELGTTMNSSQDQPALRALVPLLDEALLSLSEKDRTVLLLRFYENRPLRAVGLSFGVGEEAARKRVASALGRLADYFQVRGFRTASVGAVTAALEHTATAAPVAVANAVIGALAQVAPSAPLGLAGPVARLATLSKAQTAALCAALLITPLGWQWHTHRQVRNQLQELQARLGTARTEHSQLQTEIDRSERLSKRLSGRLAEQAALAAQQASAAERFSAWKQHLRSALTAGDYHWPEDSPFVRIPKSVAEQLLRSDLAVHAPGVLTQASRELLGLTPQERQQVEAALQTHFAAMDQLIEDGIYETNALSQYGCSFAIPSGATASKVWTVPALGDQVTSEAKDLETGLQGALGAERWALVKDEFGVIGTDTLRRVLDLDAARNPQQIAVWISDKGGEPTVGYGWQGNGGAFSKNGASLALFKAGAQPASGMNPEQFLGARTLPTAVTTRMMAWLRQQAAALPQPDSAK